MCVGVKRRKTLRAAASAGWEALCASRKVRNIWTAGGGTEVPPDQPPNRVREEAFDAVMEGGIVTDFPPDDTVRRALDGVPTLVLAWDCGDKTHPVSSAERLRELVPHAEVCVEMINPRYPKRFR